MSHAPPDVRQTTAADMKASFGHVLLTPLQLSATSHAPAEDRQTAELFTSLGQFGPVPVQFSARSQIPAAERHTTVLAANPSFGHVALPPLHVSMTSQDPAELRQVVPDAVKWQFVSQQLPKTPFALPTSHCSPTLLSIAPLPQSEVNWTVTKLPSLACVRLGLPG